MNAVKYFGYPDNWCETDGNKIQLMGALVGVKNNDIGNIFINKWCESMNPRFSYLFDDSPSTIPNCDNFKESRHDQQMLSLILYNTIYFPIYNKDLYGWVWHEPINGNHRHD